MQTSEVVFIPDRRSTVHLITLPNGRDVTVGEYARSWRMLKTLPPDRLVERFSHFPETAAEILREIGRAVHDRINRHIPGFGRGRKWSQDWERAAIQTAIRVNQPRLVIDWLPQDFRRRLAYLAHRFRCNAA